jgi:hypothetical protein
MQKELENDNRRITAARITTMPATLLDPLPTVYVTIGGTEMELFSYYPDEISFRPEEFIGLTLAVARRLKFDKDRRYLEAK